MYATEEEIGSLLQKGNTLLAEKAAAEKKADEEEYKRLIREQNPMTIDSMRDTIRISNKFSRKIHIGTFWDKYPNIVRGIQGEYFIQYQKKEKETGESIGEFKDPTPFAEKILINISLKVAFGKCIVELPHNFSMNDNDKKKNTDALIKFLSDYVKKKLNKIEKPGVNKGWNNPEDFFSSDQCGGKRKRKNSKKPKTQVRGNSNRRKRRQSKKQKKRNISRRN